MQMTSRPTREKRADVLFSICSYVDGSRNFTAIEYQINHPGSKDCSGGVTSSYDNRKTCVSSVGFRMACSAFRRYETKGKRAYLKVYKAKRGTHWGNTARRSSD